MSDPMPAPAPAPVRVRPCPSTASTPSTPSDPVNFALNRDMLRAFGRTLLRILVRDKLAGKFTLRDVLGHTILNHAAAEAIVRQLLNDDKILPLRARGAYRVYGYGEGEE